MDAPSAIGASIAPQRCNAVLRYNHHITPTVITFDAGQTLVELDLDFLVTRLAERDSVTSLEALSAAIPAAWAEHDALIAAGEGHPWRGFMTALLVRAGVADVDPLVAWLWQEQPRVNLWRKPIAGMVDLARELVAQGARIAVLSNSEGRLAELLTDVGIADAFEVIVDSGRLGFHKPDRRIFTHTLAALGLPEAVPVHIGDSWAADVVGALDAGWHAMWYGRQVHAVDDPRVAVARDPHEARAELVRLGVIAR
ncbi:MAG: HAD family hydrolase [Kofleriaceae bacterium]|nr:HAD family hydrolase [Kofleriaceae bacterium]